MIWLHHRMRIASRAASAFRSEILKVPDGFAQNLSGEFPGASPGGVVFSACDEGYFAQFGRSLITSTLQRSPAQHIHLHVYEPSTETVGALGKLMDEAGGRLTATWDSEGLNPYPPGSEHRPVYYASARFIRLNQLIEASGSPVFAIDCDSVVRDPLSGLFDAAGDADVGLYHVPRKPFPHRNRPWRRVLAGAILLSPTPAGRRFSAELASVLHRELAERPGYHVDQLALLYLHRLHRKERSTRFLDVPKTFIDWDFADDSLIWSGKGPRKNQARFQGALQ